MRYFEGLRGEFHVVISRPKSEVLTESGKIGPGAKTGQILPRVRVTKGDSRPDQMNGELERGSHRGRVGVQEPEVGVNAARRSGHNLGSWSEGLWPFGVCFGRGQHGRSALYVIMCQSGHVPILIWRYTCVY